MPVGKDTAIKVPVSHEGENIVELSAEAGPAELTLQNNRAVVTVSGVRDRLRVLLVSGQPHAGERVWRNLLKADPSVDLIHFTILRPPEKQDATPINELSLIAFPHRELFSEKLHSFDLVIFDRYFEQGILPMAYFENIANYVQDGGALLVSSGPEFAGPMSIFRTPLANVLPAQPTGEIITRAFKPMVTADGPGPSGDPRSGRRQRPGHAAELGPLVPRHRRQPGCGTGGDERARQQAAAGAGPGGQGPGGGIAVRPDLAVGARLRRRRTAGRIAAPPGPLADEGAGAGNRKSFRRGRRTARSSSPAAP